MRHMDGDPDSQFVSVLSRTTSRASFRSFLLSFSMMGSPYRHEGNVGISQMYPGVIRCIQLQHGIQYFGVLIFYNLKIRARRKCSYVKSRSIFRGVEERRALTGSNEQQRALTEKMFQKFLFVEPK